MVIKASDLVEDESLAFFQLVYTNYKKAEHTIGGYQDRHFLIGGRPVRLRFAGNGLASALTPALAHLETAPAERPELTILAWDSASSNSALPSVLKRYFDSLGEWWDHLGRRGEIRELTNDRFRFAYHLGPNIFSGLDLQENLGLYWVQDASALPYYEIGSPLRTILHWWADGGDYQFVHAGAVGLESGGVLLVGRGGSGKSTTALAALDAGLLYASDDYCLIRTDPEPYVFSVYNTAKLRGEADVKRFAHLAAMVSNKSRLENDKALLFLNDHFPKQITRGFCLKAILLPVVTQGKETRLVATGAGAALTALAPSTLFQLPSAGSAAIKTMSRLAQRVPAYQLELGTDLANAASVIKDLLLGK
ncbi:MAG TPA: hypothetical protein VLZ89_16605 [Anaerolineales bacterium]|nr:hypothetical protein [Anaerolineales bacterium]